MTRQGPSGSSRPPELIGCGVQKYLPTLGRGGMERALTDPDTRTFQVPAGNGRAQIDYYLLHKDSDMQCSYASQPTSTLRRQA
jgi:hypothetical protein